MNFKRFFHNTIHHASTSRTQLTEVQRLGKQLSEEMKELSIRRRADYLRDKLLTSLNLGVTKDNACEQELIVSLTTYGERIHDVYLTIESIMQGSIKPNRIILWLAADEFEDKPLPHTLKMQQKRGLQIEYCEDLRSYKKLIPTLEKYPEACIVTIDDDVMYDFDFLDNLLLAHQQHPDCVCAGKIHRIRWNEDSEILPYNKWHQCIEDYKMSKANFMVGVGGVLYPPHILHEDVLKKELFMTLCPYGDDIWFYTMTIMNGKQVIKAYTKNPEGDFIDNVLHQKESLCSVNTNPQECRNDKQLKAILKRYDLLRVLKSYA